MELKDIVEAVLGGKEDEALTLTKAYLSEQRDALLANGKEFIAQSLFESDIADEIDDDDEEEEEENVDDETGKPNKNAEVETDNGQGVE